MQIRRGMSSIGDNIDALIENIKFSEHYAESQRNELHAVETEISRIKSEMLTMSLEKEEVKSHLKKLLPEINKQDAALLSLEKEVKTLRNVYKELKDTYDKESRILSDKQQEVWKNRELFCNNLRKFAEDWGPLSASMTKENKRGSSKKESSSVSQSEELLLGNDLKNLEKSIEEAKEKFAEAEKNLKNVISLKEKLSEEPECGEEFVRQTQMEVEILEKQCEKAKQDDRHKYKSKDLRQLTFLPEPPLTHCPATKPASVHVICENTSFSGEIQSLQERSLPPSTDNYLWKNDENGSGTIRKFGMKRPVAAIAPAIENYHQEKDDDRNMASSPKKACSFIPKKPSSLSKKFFTHSNGWVQLEKELSDLLRTDLSNS